MLDPCPAPSHVPHPVVGDRRCMQSSRTGGRTISIFAVAEAVSLPPPTTPLVASAAAAAVHRCSGQEAQHGKQLRDRYLLQNRGKASTPLAVGPFLYQRLELGCRPSSLARSCHTLLVRRAGRFRFSPRWDGQATLRCTLALPLPAQRPAAALAIRCDGSRSIRRRRRSRHARTPPGELFLLKCRCRLQQREVPRKRTEKARACG